MKLRINIDVLNRRQIGEQHAIGILADESHHQHGERPFFPRRALRDARFQVIHNLLAGKATTYPSVDGDTADKVARTAAYEGTPARKAMELLPDPPEWELYDLEADPGQFQNLAEDPAHAETLQRMQGLLQDWRKETQDPFLDPAALARKHAEVNVKAKSIIPQ